MKCPNCQTQMDMTSMFYEEFEKFYINFVCPGVDCYVEYEGTIKRRLVPFNNPTKVWEGGPGGIDASYS